jgi:hypothetical protein
MRFLQLNTFFGSLLLALAFSTAVSAQSDEVVPVKSNPRLTHRAQGSGASRAGTLKNLVITSNSIALPFVDDFSTSRGKNYSFPNGYIYDSVANATGPCLDYQDITLIQGRFHKQQSWSYTFDVANVKVDSTPKAPIAFNSFATTAPACMSAAPIPFQLYPEYYHYTFDSATGFPRDSVLVSNDTINADTIIKYAPIVYYARLDDNWLWYDNQANINNTYPVFPPTIGVATLDGLNEYGRPHDPFIQTNGYGTADVFTSKPLLLSSTSWNDSVYLSFFYQPEGLGNYPNAPDSLVVEFRNEYTGNWDMIWSIPGFSSPPADITFKQVLLKFPQTIIPARNYFYDGFQFRFRNKSTLSGNNDHWHIDYVKLDKNRSINDTIINDIAFVEPYPSILKRYTLMPADQFVDTIDLADTVTLVVRNLNYYNNNSPATDFQGDGTELYPSNSGIYTTNLQTFNAGYSRQLSLSPRQEFTMPSILGNTDSVALIVREWIKPNDILPGNDTITRTQVFGNAMAYDDGSAERAYGLGGVGLKKVALEYKLNKPDTLVGFQILYTNIDVNVSDLVIQFNIWDTLKLGSFAQDSPIYTSLNAKPYYVDSLNGFTTYKLDTQFILSNKVYVGWSQTDTRNLQIGYDMNNTKGADNLYIFTNYNWKKSSVIPKGSPMMRLIFGDSSKIRTTAISEVSKPVNTVRLYPNPANGLVHIQTEEHMQVAEVTVCDLSGKQVMQQLTENKTFDISPLSSGMYVVQIRNTESGAVSMAKILKHD